MKIGVDLGGTNIAAAVVDEQYQIKVKDSVPTENYRSFEEIVQDIGKLCLSLTERAGLCMSDIDSIGIGSPGVPDIKNGRLLYSGNLRWNNVPLCDELKKHVGAKKIFLDNDANCTALGEYIVGAAKDFDSSVMVTLGTGLGGGIVIDGRIHSGFHYAGGEIGHMVIECGGVPCTCGRYGCWESYASVTGLIRMANEEANLHPESMLAETRSRDGALNGRNIFNCAKADDDTAKTVVKRYQYYIAEGITNIVNALHPEGVIVGGGISHEGDYLLDPIREQVDRDRFCKYVPMPAILAAKLGNDAGIIGAALLSEYQIL